MPSKLVGYKTQSIDTAIDAEIYLFGLWKTQTLVQKVESIKHLQLKNPLLMGFGIKGKAEFEQACQLVNGAIIGSSFIQLLTNSTNFKKDISQFILTIKNKSLGTI